MRDSAIDVPELVRLNAVKVDDLRARGPFRIVVEKVGEKVVAVVGDEGHCIGFANGECVHHDLIRVIVGAVCNRALEVLEVVCNLFGENLESASLHGKHAGVDPVPLWFYGLRQPEETYLRFSRVKAPLVGHELIRIDECDVGNEQRRQVNFRDEERVEVDVYNRVSFAFEHGKEFRKDCSDAGSVLEPALVGFEN